MVFLYAIFWTSVLALVHTYIVYPVLVRVMASRKRDNVNVYAIDDADLPGVTVIIPAHNEASVIREKLRSVLASSYPMHLVEIFVGSDASTDETNQYVQEIADSHPNVHLVDFSRRGKPAMVNELVGKAAHDLLLLTDANVMLEQNTLFDLIKHFKNESVSLVESNMKHSAARQDGIGFQESAYLNVDAKVKHAEGVLWGTLMGPSGGCFALRRSYYVPVPPNYLVDDFYICMKVLEQKGRAIYEDNAKVYEDVSNVLREEFRRKVRIATGDFQNLRAFSPLLLRFNALAFSFFSHKVLRWIGPLLLISAFISVLAIVLSRINDVPAALSYGDTTAAGTLLYIVSLAGMILLFLMPFIDWVAKRFAMHIFVIRMLSYFCATNVALLAGMYRFLRGVNTGTWMPTQRNQ